MNGTDLFNPKNKKFWSIGLLLLLGVMLMLLGSCDSSVFSTKSEKAPLDSEMTGGTSKPSVVSNSLMTREEEELAMELRHMLEQVAGAGKVEVTVQLASSTNNDYAINTTTGLKTTQEKDQGGGSRQITENTDSSTVVIARGDQGLEKPVVQKEVAPDVAGIMVVAQGAGTPRVKADLFRAVQVALGVEPHRIIVLPMKEGF
ncbi:hypothetical protein SPSYN_00258 [Sporotomaculum syntrophicum]|uniref:Stage III sporulation protein AG n=1 Tax=Sporotomaculum syntrophicum TaxID=182264 RepID=A0A9D2WSG1_9FIRM|nr:stage III sporulation protein AG [Sporotomaculum syntrophicum]KAF1086539.1 hypothetical protein SPSYN_00258 [Sporotomaculum syntrophicum]